MEEGVAEGSQGQLEAWCVWCVAWYLKEWDEEGVVLCH